MHRDAVEFLQEVNDVYHPTKVVCIGDEVDFHALSDYTHDPDGYSPGHELEKAVSSLAPVYELFPTVLSCVSNHTLRPFRRAHKFGIPRALLRDYNEFLNAPPGWTWEAHFVIDDVRYEHGDHLLGGGKTVASNAPLHNQQSTVFGHYHAHAGVHYQVTPEGRLLYGMNVGCLIDDKAYAFAYAKGMKSKPVHGVGIVHKGIPSFVPMLQKRGRWIGELVG